MLHGHSHTMSFHSDERRNSTAVSALCDLLILLPTPFRLSILVADQPLLECELLVGGPVLEVEPSWADLLLPEVRTVAPLSVAQLQLVWVAGLSGGEQGLNNSSPVSNSSPLPRP